jgi:hypothetical protein
VNSNTKLRKEIVELESLKLNIRQGKTVN